MIKDIEVRGVRIGDVFMNGKHSKAQVVDILEQRSMVTGDVVGHVCVVEGLGIATNTFSVPFTTVLRNRLQEVA